MCRAQFHDTPGHVYQNYQAQIRYSVKLKFLAGIARRLAEEIGTIKLPPVQTVLGKLASEASTVQGMVYAMEAAGEKCGDYYLPCRQLLYATQVYAQEIYPGFVNAIRELSGGALIMTPSCVADYANQDIADILEKVQSSPVSSSTDRVKFLKLAWDAIGSEFASRHTQYEMFYCGAQFVTRAHSFRTYDWDDANGLVQSVLDGYSLETSPRFGVAAE